MEGACSQKSNTNSDTGDPANISDDSDELDEFDNCGLEAINDACKIIYADQPNPLQAIAVKKYWMGGPDPLDFVSMYHNEGDSTRNIPPHWHYVSYGFSDLYGDGRVHRMGSRGEASGFGFELTFRLKREKEEEEPPLWPQNLMNRLANYVFQTGNVLLVGDHIPWHKPLDGTTFSHVQSMLIAEDPQLFDLDTPYGIVEFRQIVGVTSDEVKAAQKWKGAGILEMLINHPQVGPFFVTDLSREKSIFDQDAGLFQLVNEGVENDGSNLGHVTAVCTWTNISQTSEESVRTSQQLVVGDVEGASGGVPGEDKENEDISPPPQLVDAVHLYFDAEAAELLPLVARARLKKGQYFIFHNAEKEAIHFIPAQSSADVTLMVDDANPMVAQGTYIQILCSPSFIEEMSQEFEGLQIIDETIANYPKEYSFSSPCVKVTVVARGTHVPVLVNDSEILQ
ncbi:suppressor of fused homolog [Gigantopelta aegis]|uniref:suppressor of fused homolog n=1 Tax=Gigantopelta aegis TaxID=1735272 RepID=UPI001B889637|nr:suppressor of fused homolog [Gigantopelta aegis]